jgi:hypothetical protein
MHYIGPPAAGQFSLLSCPLAYKITAVKPAHSGQEKVIDFTSSTIVSNGNKHTKPSKSLSHI